MIFKHTWPDGEMTFDSKNQTLSVNMMINSAPVDVSDFVNHVNDVLNGIKINKTTGKILIYDTICNSKK